MPRPPLSLPPNRGIREISQYGPLWFGAFRLYEKLETRAFTLGCAAARRAGNPVLPPPPPPVSPSSSASSHSSSTASDSSGAIMLNWLPITRRTLLEATSRISKELVWKVLFEAAQIEERAADVVLSVVKLPIRSGLDVAVPAVAPGDAAHARQCADAFLTRARAFYVQSIVHCPANLRWKVWLAGARMELCSGNNEAAALRLLQRALSEVPAKSRSQVLLDVSRLHEYACAGTFVLSFTRHAANVQCFVVALDVVVVVPGTVVTHLQQRRCCSMLAARWATSGRCSWSLFC